MVIASEERSAPLKDLANTAAERVIQLSAEVSALRNRVAAADTCWWHQLCSLNREDKLCALRVLCTDLALDEAEDGDELSFFSSLS